MNMKKIKGQLGLYLCWPLFLGALIILMNVVVGAMDLQAGLAMCGFTLIYLLLAGFLFFYQRNRLLGGMMEFSADYAWVQKQLLPGIFSGCFRKSIKSFWRKWKTALKSGESWAAGSTGSA